MLRPLMATCRAFVRPGARSFQSTAPRCVALDTDDRKAFYCLGVNVAVQIDKFGGMKADEIDAMAAGLRDVLSGAAPQIDTHAFAQKVRCVGGLCGCAGTEAGA